MPKSPSHIHPLRDIRLALDLSQTALGYRIGLSKSMVQKIENGLERLSSAVAFRIHMLTGCDIAHNGDGEIRLRATCNREKYTKEHYLARQRFLQDHFKWDSPTCYPALDSVLRVVLSAAEQSQHLSAMLEYIATAISKGVQELKLKASLIKELSTNGDLVPASIDSILDLIAANPIQAGLAINLHRGTQDRGKRMEALRERWKRKRKGAVKIRSNHKDQQKG